MVEFNGGTPRSWKNKRLAELYKAHSILLANCNVQEYHITPGEKDESNITVVHKIQYIEFIFFGVIPWLRYQDCNDFSSRNPKLNLNLVSQYQKWY